MFKLKLFFLQLIICTSVSAMTYYVSPSGKDTNKGSIQNPFSTLQQAASVMKPGDVCYLREGRYHEAVVLENLHGTTGHPIVFASYEDEQVVLDGSEVIDAEWSVHEGNIYKARIESDIWQLFAGDKIMISARWPNATWEDGSMFNQPASWAHQADGSEYGIMINDPAYQDLASENRDFTGAIAILNIGS